MIEQKEVVEKNGMEDAQEDKADLQRRRKRKAVQFFLMGVFFIFSPLYLQTDITWILYISVLLSFLCWSVAYYLIFDDLHSSSIDTYLNILIFLGMFISFATYSISLSGKKSFEIREISWTFLFLTVCFAIYRLPSLFEWCKQRKDKIKAFFSIKNIAAVSFGILAFGTALFQFLQVLLQIFHH